MDLYAKLHGLSGLTSKPRSNAALQRKPEDTKFEKTLNNYINSSVEEQTQDVQPGLLSSQQFSDKIKQEINDRVRDFDQSFSEGYKLISASMATEGLQMPRVDEEELKIFDDPVALSDELEAGGEIYILLGFSFDDLISFQTIANDFFYKGEFQKASDCFFFLTTVASDMPIFWNALAITYIQLQQYEKAEKGLLNSLGLDPTYEDAYLNCVHVYIKTKKFDEANKLCDRGIAYAIENGDASWSQQLQQLLNDVKEVVKKEYTI